MQIIFELRQFLQLVTNCSASEKRHSDGTDVVGIVR